MCLALFSFTSQNLSACLSFHSLPCNLVPTPHPMPGRICISSYPAFYTPFIPKTGKSMIANSTAVWSLKHSTNWLGSTHWETAQGKKGWAYFLGSQQSVWKCSWSCFLTHRVPGHSDQSHSCFQHMWNSDGELTEAFALQGGPSNSQLHIACRGKASWNAVLYIEGNSELLVTYTGFKKRQIPRGFHCWAHS